MYLFILTSYSKYLIAYLCNIRLLVFLYFFIISLFCYISIFKFLLLYLYFLLLNIYILIYINIYFFLQDYIYLIHLSCGCILIPSDSNLFLFTSIHSNKLIKESYGRNTFSTILLEAFPSSTLQNLS